MNKWDLFTYIMIECIILILILKACWAYYVKLYGHNIRMIQPIIIIQDNEIKLPLTIPHWFAPLLNYSNGHDIRLTFTPVLKKN